NEKTIAEQKAAVDIAAADAARQTQADLVGYASLRAPFAGLVTQKNVSTKQFVQPSPQIGAEVRGSKIENASALYVVKKTDVVRICTAVPETDADWVRIGMTATIRVRGLPGQEFKRPVTRTASSLHPLSRTLLTEIDVDNPLKDQKEPKLGRWL